MSENLRRRALQYFDSVRSKPNLRDVPLSLSLPSAQTELNLAATLLSLFQNLITSQLTQQLTPTLSTLASHAIASDQIVTIEREMMDWYSVKISSDVQCSGCLFLVSGDWFSHGRGPPPFYYPDHNNSVYLSEIEPVSVINKQMKKLDRTQRWKYSVFSKTQNQIVRGRDQRSYKIIWWKPTVCTSEVTVADIIRWR